MSYRLRLYPYSGCGPIDLLDDDDLDACRLRAARRIRKHRNDYEYPVTILNSGLEWELESDPDGYYMISDGEGILSIEKIIGPEDEDGWDGDPDEPDEFYIDFRDEDMDEAEDDKEEDDE